MTPRQNFVENKAKNLDDGLNRVGSVESVFSSSIKGSFDLLKKFKKY